MVTYVVINLAWGSFHHVEAPPLRLAEANRIFIASVRWGGCNVTCIDQYYETTQIPHQLFDPWRNIEHLSSLWVGESSIDRLILQNHCYELCLVLYNIKATSGFFDKVEFTTPLISSSQMLVPWSGAELSAHGPSEPPMNGLLIGWAICSWSSWPLWTTMVTDRSPTSHMWISPWVKAFEDAMSLS